jgi:LmbE family N-acetylglucosaminyl deacetylase
MADIDEALASTNIEFWLGNGPEVISPPSSGSVLAVAAHPDDIESECAGTLALAARSGCEVRLLLVTSGDDGSGKRDVGWTSHANSAREHEALAAATVLGLAEVAFLRYPDGSVESSLALRRDIVLAIRTWLPAHVFTYDPQFTLPLYISHPDHRAVGRTTLDAIYPDARYDGAFPDQLQLGLTSHIVDSAWLFASAFGSKYVDISSVFARKVEARLQHRSQLSDPAELRAKWEDRAESTGRRAGLAAAEAFTVIALS